MTEAMASERVDDDTSLFCRSSLLLTTVSGLEYVTQREVQSLAPNVKAHRMKNFVLVELPAGSNLNDVKTCSEVARWIIRLRSVEFAHALLGRYVVPDADNKAFGELAGRAPNNSWTGALALRRRLSRLHSTTTAEIADGACDPSSIPNFRVTVETKSAREDRNVVGRCVSSALQQSLGWQPHVLDFEFEVKVRRREQYMDVTIPLHKTALSLSHCSHWRDLSCASLRPVVAFAIVAAACPEPGDLIVDITCGAGTISEICSSAFPRCRYIMGDIADVAVTKAKANATRLWDRDIPTCAPTLGCIAAWDATHLPFADDSVDIVVGNLPFGERVGSHTDNRTMYPLIIAEVLRVLKPATGRSVLLSTERSVLESVFADKKDSVGCFRHWVNLGGKGAFFFNFRHKSMPPPCDAATQLQ